MPVSVALGRGPDAWVHAAGGPAVEPRRTALLGYRDAEESIEHGMAQPDQVSAEIRCQPIETVRAEGPAAAAAAAVASATTEGTPFWLHIDVDVLDQDVFPATDYLMPDGMQWEELRATLAPLLTSPALIGASLACYNPEKDPNQTCGGTLVSTLSAAVT
jgi:arginase